MATKNIPPKYRAKIFHKYIDDYAEGDLMLRSYGVFVDGVKVDPDTLQKLCGYDKDGNEVYRTYKLKIEMIGGYHEYSV